MTVLEYPNESTRDYALVSPEHSDSNVQQHWSSPIPFSMPEEQTYYWSLAWQTEEAGALADLAAGRFLEFTGDDPHDVARWLREPEE